MIKKLYLKEIQDSFLFTQFKHHRLNFNQFYLTLRMDPFWCHHSGSEYNYEQWQ